MNKEFIICICLSVVGGGGYLASHQYAAYQAKAALQQQQAVAQAKAARQPDAQKPLTVAQIEEKRRQEADTASKQKQTEQQTAQSSVAGEFKSLKISSILLGTPNMAIINKKSYEEGDSLVSGTGKKAKITQIKAEGILLTCGDASFQVDLPTARDLGNAAR